MRTVEPTSLSTLALLASSGVQIDRRSLLKRGKGQGVSSGYSKVDKVLILLFGGTKNKDTQTHEYPSVAWIIVPLLVIPLGFYLRARLAARKLARTGIGRGAPGFQTNVRRIAVTPEIAARLRRGEQVSPEEIAAAQEEAGARMAAAKVPADKDENEEEAVPPVTPSPSSRTAVAAEEEWNEWLPEELKKGARNAGAKTRKGKRRR